MKRIILAIRKGLAKKKKKREDRKFNQWWLSLRESCSAELVRQGYDALPPLTSEQISQLDC